MQVIFCKSRPSAPLMTVFTRIPPSLYHPPASITASTSATISASPTASITAPSPLESKPSACLLGRQLLAPNTSIFASRFQSEYTCDSLLNATLDWSMSRWRLRPSGDQKDLSASPAATCLWRFLRSGRLLIFCQDHQSGLTSKRSVKKRTRSREII